MTSALVINTHLISLQTLDNQHRARHSKDITLGLCYLDVLDQGYNTGDTQGMTPNIIKHDYADAFMAIIECLKLVLFE